MKKFLIVCVLLLLGLSGVAAQADTSARITSFTSSVSVVDQTALANRTARIPVSWATVNRPDNSNLIFEQVLPDGRVMNVELPRENPYVASSGDGVAAPFPPGGNATSITLRVRLVNLLTQQNYDQRELVLNIGTAPTPSGAIRFYNASVTEVSRAALVNRSARIPVTWAVDNRPEGSNLIFDQLMPDGSLVNVELPRSNPYVSSSGNGIAAPVLPGGSAATITLRLRLVNLSTNQVIDYKDVTLNITEAPVPTVVISAFTAPVNTVSRAALANRTARIPVSWAVTNRPEGSNLVFEQVLPNGSFVNVELPRSNPYVSSAGDGVTAPVDPGTGLTSLTLQLRVIDLASQTTLAQKTIPITISDTVVKPTIRFFTTSATGVDRAALANRTARIPVSWAVDNRPEGSNLVFEQRLENGSIVNVELPRQDPYVASSGNGIAAPFPPQNANTATITLQLRVVNLSDNSTLTQQEISLPITGQVVVPTATVPSPVPTATPMVTGAREIFLRGQSLGNRANVFTKVGDSLTDTPYFLRQIVYGYNLRAFSYLQPVVQYFSSVQAYDANSFGSVSQAARASWSSFSVLDPDVANRSICQSGETPLACEYRVVKPAVALIMIGTNDMPAFPGSTYETNMRQIIETSIQMGVIPVISTLPPRPDLPDRVNEYNQVIFRLAQTYNIPIWDLHKELAKLPSGGVGPDNVHLSVPPTAPGGTVDFTPENLAYGTTMRNLTALQILDYVWRTAMS